MLRTLGLVGGGLLLVLLVVGIVFIVGMRRKSPRVLDAVRRFNRGFTNPRVLKSAGTAGKSTSVIRHVGRSSGKPYETPVGAFATGDGFLIALPYGTRSDWLKNVLAQGSAVLLDAGATHEVSHPELVATTDVASELPPGELRTLRMFRVTQCLRLQRADELAP